MYKKVKNYGKMSKTEKFIKAVKHFKSTVSTVVLTYRPAEHFV